MRPGRLQLPGLPGGILRVTGRPDQEWGERVVAFVVPTPHTDPPDLEALRALVKESLPGFCAPRELVIVAELPRTAIGKVRRAMLA